MANTFILPVLAFTLRPCLIPGVWKAVALDFSRWLNVGSRCAAMIAFPAQEEPSPARKVGGSGGEGSPWGGGHRGPHTHSQGAALKAFLNLDPNLPQTQF